MTALATREQTELDVAKKRVTPPRNDEAVRIRTDVAAKARIAAAYFGLSISDYISNALEPIVTKDINEGHSRISKGVGSPKGRKSDPSPDR